jgi:hypothetical protein
MTPGYLIPRSTNGDRLNLRILIGNRRALFPVYFCDLHMVIHLPLCSARSGFSFLSTPEGIVLHGMHETSSSDITSYDALQEVTVKNTPRVSVLLA